MWDLEGIESAPNGAYLFQYAYDEARASVLFIERQHRLIPVGIDMESNKPEGYVWVRDLKAQGCVWQKEFASTVHRERL